MRFVGFADLLQTFTTVGKVFVHGLACRLLILTGNGLENLLVFAVDASAPAIQEVSLYTHFPDDLPCRLHQKINVIAAQVEGHAFLDPRFQGRSCHQVDARELFLFSR